MVESKKECIIELIDDKTRVWKTKILSLILSVCSTLTYILPILAFSEFHCFPDLPSLSLLYNLIPNTFFTSPIMGQSYFI